MIKKTILIFTCFFLFSLVGCMTEPAVNSHKEVVVEKTNSELIDEVHNIDTETTFLFNNFDSSSKRFKDSLSVESGSEQFKTIEQNAKLSKEDGKKAIIKFDELLSKIADVKKRDLSSNQKAYLERLELAGNSYKELLVADAELTDIQTNFSKYDLRMKIFSDNFNEIITADKQLAIYGSQKDWDSAKKVLDSMNISLMEAQKEIATLKSELNFKFIGEYDKFISSMNSYISKEQSIIFKKQQNLVVSDSEINAALAEGMAVGSIFKADQSGVLWVEGEKDELESFRRTYIYPKQTETQQAYNRADAYYQDAKLRYEQLMRGDSITKINSSS